MVISIGYIKATWDSNCDAHIEHVIIRAHGGDTNVRANARSDINPALQRRYSVSVADLSTSKYVRSEVIYVAKAV